MNQDLLKQLRSQKDPKVKWRLLEIAGQQPDDSGELEAERLWWHARYTFMDKKRSHVRDRFIWLFFYFSSWQNGTSKEAGEPGHVYRETLESPQLAAAMAADDRLHRELYDAALLYVQTLRHEKKILGLFGGEESIARQHERIAAQLVGLHMAPMAAHCEERPHFAQLVSCLAEAANAAYPGIEHYLREAAGEIRAPGIRHDIEELLEEAFRGS